MNSNIKLALCTAILIAMTACSNMTSLPTNEMPDVGVSMEEMNTEIHLSVPKSLNTFKFGEKVFVEIRVISSNHVEFERGFGARMFIYEHDQWTEVPNLTSYEYLETEGYVFIPYADNPFNLGVTVVEPKLPDTKDAIAVRIILVGSIYRDEERINEITAAYVDVNLKP